MSIKTKIATALFGDVIEQKVKEATIPIGAIDADDFQFRRLTGKADKDLSPLTHERMLKIAYFLWDTNPLAHRIIELTKDFIVGDGLTYTAEDEKVKEVLDTFWNNSVNQWDLKQDQKALEIGLYGEQCYPVFVNDVDGEVTLGYVDPLSINCVVTDPENSEVVKAIIVKSQLVGQQKSKKVLATIQVDNDPKSKTFGLMIVPEGEIEILGVGNQKEKVTPTGGCFFFAVNKVSNAQRGRSDLLPLSDWIDAYDQLLFNRLDRASLMNNFVWDITIENADDKKIKEFLANNPPPTPGSIRAHNQKVKWEAVTPDLKSADAQKEAKLIKSHILGGIGYPEHWFAEGGNVNRATAQEMGTPTFKKLTARQKYFVYMVEFMFKFVIDQAIIHKKLAPEVNKNFTIIAPEISIKDTAILSTALQQITQSLMIAQNQNWISEETAREIFANVSRQISGIEIDTTQEEDRMADNKVQETVKDYKKKNVRAALKVLAKK